MPGHAGCDRHDHDHESRFNSISFAGPDWHLSRFQNGPKSLIQCRAACERLRETERNSCSAVCMGARPSQE